MVMDISSGHYAEIKKKIDNSKSKSTYIFVQSEDEDVKKVRVLTDGEKLYYTQEIKIFLQAEV